MSQSEIENNEISVNKRIYQMRAEICRALADPVRHEILDLLKEQERTVSELVAAIGVRQANVSQHLAIMRQAGLVATRRQGNTIYYSLKNPVITQACNIIKQFLVDKLSEDQHLISSVQISDN